MGTTSNGQEGSTGSPLMNLTTLPKVSSRFCSACRLELRLPRRRTSSSVNGSPRSHLASSLRLAPRSTSTSSYSREIFPAGQRLPGGWRGVRRSSRRTPLPCETDSKCRPAKRAINHGIRWSEEDFRRGERFPIAGAGEPEPPHAHWGTRKVNVPFHSTRSALIPAWFGRGQRPDRSRWRPASQAAPCSS